MRGGSRPGAGRKKGFAALEAERARDFIAAKVATSLEPIISRLIEQAEQGDVRAIKELFDRAYGKVVQGSESITIAPIEPITGMRIVYEHA